jgi:hypothetical protein
VHVISQVESAILWALWIVLIAVQAFALIDVVTRKGQAFTATGKLTKPAWLGITAFALFMEVVGQPGGVLAGGIGLLVLAGVVASFVYLADVRPAVRGVSGPSRW